MADHIKPTSAELEAGIQKAQEELAVLDSKDETTNELHGDQGDAGKEAAAKDNTESTGADATNGLSSEDGNTTSQGKQEETQDEIDYRRKFTESTREAQILASRNKKITTAVDEASGIAAPTDEIMTEEYPDWDIMSATEQKLAKDSYINKKRFEIIHQASQEGKDIQVWNEKVDKFVENPETLAKYQELEGKEDEFKLFAGKPSRRGVDLEDLVLAFKGYESNKPKFKNKGKMFENGSAGQKGVPNPNADKLTPMEGRALMKSNYKEYAKLLKAGKILNE